MIMKNEKKDPNSVVKCACGLPMRAKDWADHWRTCRYGSSVEVTRQDIADLEAQEARLEKEAEEHKAWLEGNKK
jgi:hypothetical protein